MIRDEDLRSSLDYSEGQKAAAHRVLVELVNLFYEYRDDIRIVGGWVPDLMFPGEGHVGSVDVDLLINHIKLKDSGYLTSASVMIPLVLSNWLEGLRRAIPRKPRSREQ